VKNKRSFISYMKQHNLDQGKHLNIPQKLCLNNIRILESQKPRKIKVRKNLILLNTLLQGTKIHTIIGSMTMNFTRLPITKHLAQPVTLDNSQTC